MAIRLIFDCKIEENHAKQSSSICIHTLLQPDAAGCPLFLVCLGPAGSGSSGSGQAGIGWGEGFAVSPIIMRDRFLMSRYRGILGFAIF